MITEKKCTRCGETKSVSEFYKCSKSASGLVSSCKVCLCTAKKNWKKANKEKVNAAKRLWQDTNKEKMACLKKSWYNANFEKIRLEKKKYYLANKQTISARVKEYNSTNSDKRAALTAKYRAAKLKATPVWLNQGHLFEINDFYESAKMFQLYTGTEYHVDHIVPLQGETVCGLHVPWNLQLLPWDENLSKQHRYWPDMPEKDNVKEQEWLVQVQN